MRRFYPVFLSLLLLGACKDITHVQTGYVADRDECRGNAENNASVYSQPEAYGLSNRDRNTALLQLFCECMRDKDWKVAGCPKPAAPVVATAQPAPTVVVVQSPSGQPAMMPAAAPAPAAAPITAKRRKKAYCAAPAVCAAPADSGTGTSSSPQTPDQENQQLQGILQRQ